METMPEKAQGAKQLSFDGRTRLQVMVDLAIARLQHYAQFDAKGYYLAFSGGKGSGANL